MSNNTPSDNDFLRISYTRLIKLKHIKEMWYTDSCINIIMDDQLTAYCIHKSADSVFYNRLVEYINSF